MKNVLVALLAGICINPIVHAQKQHSITKFVSVGPSLSADLYTYNTNVYFRSYTIEDKTAGTNRTWVSYDIYVIEPSTGDGGESGRTIIKRYNGEGTVPEAAIRIKTPKLLTLDLDPAQYGDLIFQSSAEYCTDWAHCVPMTPVDWQLHVQCRANEVREWDTHSIGTARTRSLDGLNLVQRWSGTSSGVSCVMGGTVAGLNLGDLGIIPGEMGTSASRRMIREFESWKE